MPQLAEVQAEKVAGFVNRGYNRKNQERIEQEEKELQELMQNGPQEEEVQEEPEVKAEEEPTSPEEKSFKKRYGDLRRHMQEKEKEWQEKFDALEGRMKQQKIVPPKSDEDIAAWARKYPDVAGIVETIAAKKAQELFQKAESRFRELDEVQYEATRTKAENEIRKSHPDFDKLRDSDDFHNWVEEQPKWVQDAVYENADDAASVVRVIDLYKVDKGMTPSQRKTKAKEAASVVSKGSRTTPEPTSGDATFRESQVAKMSDKEFEENYDAILSAQRSGKFVYDISGRAR